MNIKVRMVPHVEELGGESGISTVVRAYFKHLPEYGIELVSRKADSFDVLAIHAGLSENLPGSVNLVSHLHGLYWTADLRAAAWEWDANKNVIEACRKACQITTPSQWVAETIRRDLRVNPTVIPHGIEWQDWIHSGPHKGYVLGYAKNRTYTDVCDPTFLTELALKFPKVTFMATFAPPDPPANIKVIGVQPHAKMKKIIQEAACVISPIKETFGVLTLEAMAAGVPVLGYAYGGNLDLVSHQKTGYLVNPGHPEDLTVGLNYCLEHGKSLGANAQEAVKRFGWDTACQLLAGVYEAAARPEPPTVSVIIPSYNYSGRVGRAIESVLSQTYPHISNIIVVDDGSEDGRATERSTQEYTDRDSRVRYLRQEHAGVACARNFGISRASTKYICCLDADDAIDPLFIEACVQALEEDRALGIAYAGLTRVYQDGKTELSDWPGQFDYDGALRTRNPVPTCNVFRREAWERVGGYRQRYAPRGAGAEDGELWLRMGAYGWGAKKATDAGLFLYSVGTGYVSGDRTYQQVDYTALHPWTKDGQHPFASVATPKRRSHPVRQYDEPVISVIIPVGPGHKGQIFNALDSLEGQTFRKWEVIVVDDTGNPEERWSFDNNPDALIGYPYVRMVLTQGKQGAGYARNRGAEAARAPFLIFMDADDNLASNDALQLLLDAWTGSEAIIYTDYLGKSYVSKEEAQRLQNMNRLLQWDEKTGLALARHMSSHYDCERALQQPKEPFYIWNLITSLVPRAWHFGIGGFDEGMPSWEDWDYWLRMARAGRCFERIPEPLVAYRFYTGTRREIGQAEHRNLIQYLLQKFQQEAKPMPCGCKKKPQLPVAQVAIQQGRTLMAPAVDDEMVLVSYTHPNRGAHRVIGAARFATAIIPQIMIRDGQGWRFNYGYWSGGGQSQFYVHRNDIELQPGIFIPAPAAAPEPMALAVPEPEPEPTKLAFDPQTIPGVTRAFAAVFNERGFDSADCILDLGMEGLMKIDGMTDKRANTILAGAQKLADKTKTD